MNSSRLPGKVMIEVSINSLIYLIENLKTISVLDDIVVATTTNTKDDKICNHLEKLNISILER